MLLAVRMPQFRLYKFVSACFLLLLNTPRAAAAGANTLRVLVFFVSVQHSVQQFFGNDEASFGSCNGCFCITNPGESCPVDRKPPTEFGSLIPLLRAFTWENPYSLDCDPFGNDLCDTTPALEEGGACVIAFSGPEKSCPDNWSYSVSTYPGSFEDAQADSSVYVTHGGPCGVCSSLQDLALYMELGVDLQANVVGCRNSVRKSKSNGIACFQDVGFTQGCASLWYYNIVFTAKKCRAPCVTSLLLDLPTYGPPPECKLTRCVQCDETYAGPTLKKYDGRNRRNSRILSETVRLCSESLYLEQNNPCEQVR